MATLARPVRRSRLLQVLGSGAIRRAAAACAATLLASAAAHAEDDARRYLEHRWAGTDLVRIAAALEQFREDHGSWPAGDPLRQVAPRYLAPAPRADPWGTPYRVDFTQPAVRSAGPDRTFGTEDDLTRAIGPQHPEGPRAPAPPDGKPAPRRDRASPSAPRVPVEVARTHARLERLARALGSFRAQRGHYPVADALGDLRDALVPEHLPADRWTDGDAWGRPWRYRADDVGSACTLVSAGADGLFEKLVPLQAGAVTGPERDLVVASGRFVRWPAGLRGSDAEPPAARRASGTDRPDPATAAEPGTRPAPDGSRLTEDRLRAIAEALEAAKRRDGSYPQSDDAARLVRELGLSVEATDAWGHRLSYLSFASGSRYVLAAGGRDGRLDRSLEDYARGARPDPGERGDLVVVNGQRLE